MGFKTILLCVYKTALPTVSKFKTILENRTKSEVGDQTLQDEAYKRVIEQRRNEFFLLKITSQVLIVTIQFLNLF